MSSSDFEAELRQSVADNLALISNAAKAAKARIGQSVAGSRPAPAAEPADFEGPRPAVNFAADEPVYENGSAAHDTGGDGTRSAPEDLPFAESPAFADADQFEDVLPEGAINVDEFALENVDDEGIPMWEDPP